MTIPGGIPGPSGNSPVLQALGSGAYKGAELAVDLLTAQIYQNLATALSNLRGYLSDPSVTTEVPRPESYFQYEMAEAYRAPAIFVIIQDMAFRQDQQKANHVSALDQVVVAAVVEDRVKRLVTKKAWRYQAALVQCLNQVSLTSADGTLRLFSRVKRCAFSGVVDLKDPKSPSAVFRQEVTLQLEVEHIENLE